jgi:hypothetical protein
MDYKKMNEFVEKMEEALKAYKEGIREPLTENVTIMLSPDEIKDLKDLFVDGIRYNRFLRAAKTFNATSNFTNTL